MRIFVGTVLLSLLVFSCCAQENIPKFDEKSVPVLNEELRKLNADKASKTYVDEQIAANTVTFFGDWQVDSFNDETSYLASTDGFVVAFSDGAGGNFIGGYTDASNPPTTYIIGSYGTYSSFTMPVKKGHYWKVNCDNAAYTISWIPLGD